MQTIDYMKMIGQFMDKYGQKKRYLPEIPTLNELRLRSKLVEEEAGELITAINKCLTYEPSMENSLASRMEESALLTEVADGIADTLYVVFGACHTFGIPIEVVIEEVHRSNMTKPQLGHDEVGNKVQKGKYSPAQITAVLKPYIIRRREEEKRGVK